MQAEKIAIVFNPIGGSAKAGTVDKLQNALKPFGEVEMLATTAEPGSAKCLTAEAVRRGARLVIANGGDGTACLVAEAIAGTNTAMAVLPGGTGNLFARSFYPVPTVDEFVRMLRSGTPQPIDTMRLQYTDMEGKEHSRLSLVGVGFGPISDAISDANPKWKRLFGKLTYTVGVTRQCLTPNAQKFVLTTSGHVKTEVEHGLAIFVLNVAPLTMAMLSRGCNASDGLLDVAVFAGNSVGNVARTAFHLASGKPERSPHFDRFRSGSVLIQSELPVRPNVDGDPVEATKEVLMTVNKGAVHVIVCP